MDKLTACISQTLFWAKLAEITQTLILDLTLDVSLLVIKFKLPQFLYPVPVVVHFYECKPITSSEIRITTLTFGNDDKSHQNKSHNEITIQLYVKMT